MADIKPQKVRDLNLRPQKVADLDSERPQKVDDLEPDTAEYGGQREKFWGPDPQKAQEQTLETPWIDPVDAITGPLGFARKAGIKAASKAVAGSLAAEPFVGGAQELIDKWTGKVLPEPAKIPVNMLTGLVVGDMLSTGFRQAGRLAKIRPKPGRFKGRKERESKALRTGAMEEITGAPPEPDIDLPSVTEKSLTRQLGEGATGLYTKYIGSPIWDQLIMKHIPKMLERVPGGKAVNRAALYEYRGDLPQTKEYMQMREQMERGIGIGQDYAINLGNRLQKFPEKQQMVLGEYIRGERTELPKNLKQIGDEAKDVLYKLGKESVDTGLLDEKTFFKNAGRYMPRLYTTKEYQQKLAQYGLKKPERLDLSRFKRRKDIPKEIREQMGEILTPGYPVAKGVAQLTNDIQRSKFFKGIARNPEWARTADEAAENIPGNFKQLSKSKKLGELSEAYIHPEIHKELEDVAKTIELPEKVWLKSLGAWKFGKVILSPKTHMRNVFSNSVLAHLGGMPMTSQPRYMSLAAREMAKKGEYWKQAKKTGLLDASFVQKEMGQLFDQINSNMKGIKANSIPESLGAFGKALQGLKWGGRKASDLYQAEEQWFKMGKFIHNIEQKGMDVEDAAKDAEKWLFNYGKLTRFQKGYRKHPLGAPFATFTFKSLPRVAETAIKYPWRFAAPLIAMNAVQEAAQQKFGDTEEQEKAKRELLPDWMRGQLGPANPNFLRVPVTDETGREYYLNLTYMLPWGDIGEQGGFMGIPGGIRPMSQPGVSELAQQIGNYDFFWQEPIVKETEVAGKEYPRMEAAKQRLGHAYQHFVPTPGMDIGKGISAFQGRPDYRGRTRPNGVVAADVFGGAKMYPVDYSERVSQLIREKAPRKGWVAQRISGEIKTLAVKKSSVLKAGNEKLAQEYQDEIDKKIKQLEGLAKETAEIGETYKKAMGQ